MSHNDHTHDNPHELSKVELAKAQGRNLRGTIADVLADPAATHFQEDDLVQLKFHGVYQQDDRDARNERRKAGLDKDYSFMIRVAVPGGRCTAEQYLTIDRLASDYGNGTVRLTTRQAYQLHGVRKDNLKQTMLRVNKMLMTSLAACGDIPRNMMATPAPFDTPVHRGVLAMARALQKDLAPATGAYHEIWCDGEKHLDSDDLKAEEPFYGDRYLPRKFKVGVAIDDDNSIDVYAYDCGLIALTEGHGPDRRITGYNLTVGGGFGMTHQKEDTIARIASDIGRVAPEHALRAVREVVAIFRDHGNRADRRHARIKYLIEDWGVQRFTDELRRRCGFDILPPAPLPRQTQLDHLGRYDQGDGRQFLGVWIECGRITDRPAPGPAYRSALRQIARELSPTIILTPMQSVLLADLPPAHVDLAIDILREHRVPLVEELSKARRYMMACPALPTCGLALAESERVHPDVVADIESLLEDHGLDDVDLTIRMTGCPNGCARPYNADIGLVGRKPGLYNLYLGGGLSGQRMADLFAADVPQADIASTLRPFVERFAAQRTPGENLSDFYRRAVATDRPARSLINGKETPALDLYQVGLPTA